MQEKLQSCSLSCNINDCQNGSAAARACVSLVPTKTYDEKIFPFSPCFPLRLWYNERMTNTDYEMTLEQFSQALTVLGIPQDRHEDYFEDGFSVTDAQLDWEWQREVDAYAEAHMDYQAKLQARNAQA